jgi:hypothetical protein
MDLFDRHLVNRRLGNRQPLKQRFRPRAPGFGKCGPIDQREDLGETPVRMRMTGMVLGALCWVLGAGC